MADIPIASTQFHHAQLAELQRLVPQIMWGTMAMTSLANFQRGKPDIPLSGGGGGGGGSPALVATTDVIPLGTVDPGLYMARQTLTTNKVLTRGSVIPFGACLVTFLVNGTNTIDLSQFTCVSGSSYLSSGIFTGTASHLYSFQFAVVDGTAVVGISDLGLIDATPPTLLSAAVANSTPTRIDLTWSEAMNNALSAPAAFAVSAGHPLTGHTYVDATHSYLTTSTAFIGAEGGKTLAYTQPATSKMQDLAGNLLANFSGVAITNNVLAPNRADNLSLAGFAASDGGSPWTAALGSPSKVSGHYTRPSGTRGIVALDTGKLLQDQTWTINPGPVGSGASSDYNQMMYRFTDINNNVTIAIKQEATPDSQLQVAVTIGGTQVVYTFGSGYSLNSNVNNTIRGYFSNANTFKVDVNGVNVPSLTTDISAYSSTLTSTKIAWFMTEIEPQHAVFNNLA